jgi:Axonemal dynein light chain
MNDLVPVSKFHVLKLSDPIEVPAETTPNSVLPSLASLVATPTLDIQSLLPILVSPVSHEPGKIQYPSTETSTRSTLVALQQKVNESLIQAGARTSGICPIRMSIFDSLFNELIRDTAVSVSPIQGVLLKRVKEEMDLRLTAYRVLFESGVLWGERKSLQSSLNAPAVTEDDSTEDSIKSLERKIKELNRQLEVINRKSEEAGDRESARFNAEVSYLEKQHTELSRILDQIEKGEFDIGIKGN